MAKKNNNGNVVAMVWPLAEKIVKQLGLELWDVRFVKEGSGFYLRIFIDSENGVTIEDCEATSRALDAPLDELDPIAQNYCLEVCSPGLERELVRDEHFKKCKEQVQHNHWLRGILKCGECGYGMYYFKRKDRDYV